MPHLFINRLLHVLKVNCKLIRKSNLLWRYRNQSALGVTMNHVRLRHDSKLKSSNSQTIFALSSGMGKCGVAVIRVSGPECKQAVQTLSRHIMKSRVATLCKLRHPISGDILDKALVLWFPGPESFTGEDCAEFHVHGGPAVILAVLDALSNVPGLQHAKAGDFTKQAFINGKMDLTEVEGLGDLIHAETEAQRKQALRQMEGDLGKLYSTWRTRLIKCLANCEAFIDFSEEENIEDDVLETVQQGVMAIEQEISSHLRDSRRGERLRNGIHIAILGQPNAGKSSLLNIMARRPAAIVSPIAGTTRDIVETALNLGGYPVVISDTAGIRMTDNEVEKEGVKRAIERARSADLKILILDGSEQRTFLEAFSSKPNPYQAFTQTQTIWNSVYFNTLLNHDSCSSCSNGSSSYSGSSNGSGSSGSSSCSINDVYTVESIFSEEDTVIVINKRDLMETVCVDLVEDLKSVYIISCKTEEGLDRFLDALTQKIGELCGNPLEGPPSLTQSRHRIHLTLCLELLQDFYRLQNVDVVLATERLRLAAREIGQITGAISADDVLDVLFQDFCIGK